MERPRARLEIHDGYRRHHRRAGVAVASCLPQCVGCQKRADVDDAVLGSVVEGVIRVADEVYIAAVVVAGADVEAEARSF